MQPRSEYQMNGSKVREGFFEDANCKTKRRNLGSKEWGNIILYTLEIRS